MLMNASPERCVYFTVTGAIKTTRATESLAGKEIYYQFNLGYQQWLEMLRNVYDKVIQSSFNLCSTRTCFSQPIRMSCFICPIVGGLNSKAVPILRTESY